MRVKEFLQERKNDATSVKKKQGDMGQEGWGKIGVEKDEGR